MQTVEEAIDEIIKDIDDKMITEWDSYCDDEWDLLKKAGYTEESESNEAIHNMFKARLQKEAITYIRLEIKKCKKRIKKLKMSELKVKGE